MTDGGREDHPGAAANRHLTEALEAISGPEPDVAKCEAFIDMANDVVPTIIDGEVR